MKFRNQEYPSKRCHPGKGSGSEKCIIFERYVYKHIFQKQIMYTHKETHALVTDQV